MSKRTKSLVLILTLVVMGSMSVGQESLKEVIEQEGFAWMIGRWKGILLGYEEVTVTYQWAAKGHAIVSSYTRGESSSGQGLIYFDAEKQQVRLFGVDSQGQASEGTWEVQGDRAVLKTTMFVEEFGEYRNMGFVYSKVNDNAMKVEVYGLQDGELSYDPLAEIDYKREVLASASKVEGKWKAEIETNMGMYSYTVVYKVDGERLTGTVSSELGESDLANGKIKGNEFEYTYDLRGYTVKHNGKLVAEDQIKIKVSGDVPASEYTITRAK